MSFPSRSANSGQKSKRSFNSTTSNNNSDSNNKENKKRKSNQKTLGVAWGANSLSSSRSSFRKSPFSDFGSYMVEKNRKLQNQFDAEASSSSYSGSVSGKPIFHGVSIFVDGFTVPSSQELKGYMLKYGGRFENYFSRHHVTHIICSNLPDSKIKNLRSFSGGLPVVKPTWILDSAVANRLLSWVPYQLDQLSDNQPKLSAFFGPKSRPVSKNRDPLQHMICQEKLEIEDPSFQGDTSEETKSSKLGEFEEKGRQIIEETNGFLLENTNETMVREPSSGDGNSHEVEVEETSSSGTEEERTVKNEPQSCLQQPSASVNSYFYDKQNTKGSSSSTVVGPSNQHHSTLGDPNFVENYFKTSRLHFIGTWRSRYRKRFPISSSWFKSKNSHQDGSDNAHKATVIHIDMDCFFVSVAIKNHPELQDKPVAVCHSANPKGTAEISSANYPARAFGVKAGMFVRDAKALCPHLVICPYNFEAYEEVADQFYDILHKHCDKVQAVSCDEAFLDVTELDIEDPELLTSKIREEIFEITGCTASAGIAKNMLVARLATRTAKPAGQCYIPPERVDEYLNQLPINALPGIGYVLEQKLKTRNIWTCGQLRMISKDSLHKDFGVKIGDMLWNYSRGVDNRLVGMIQESKSIGAEVNWGVRFRNWQDSQHFLLCLCREVQLRLQGCGVQGRSFSLKIKRRRKNAEEPAKYMGCGDCENLSHSITVPVATDDLEVLQRITKQLFGSFHLDVKDIRGVGLQVSKLECADTSKQGLERNSLKSWLTSASVGTKQCDIGGVARERATKGCDEQSASAASDQLCSGPVRASVQVENNPGDSQSLNQVSALPPLCDLDIGVIECLPRELLSELNETYGGKLMDFIAKSKGRSNDISNPSDILLDEPTNGQMAREIEAPLSDPSPLKNIPQEKHTAKNMLPAPVSGAGSCNQSIDTYDVKTDFMPSSLTQVDTSVLQQLPEELRADIVDLLPAHRRQEPTSDASCEHCTEKPQGSLDIRTTENQSKLDQLALINNLWIGNPPRWVDIFKGSNFLMLNILAEMYYKSYSTKNLSSILQCTISEFLHAEDGSSDGLDEAIYSFCELLKQYIKLKIEVDIEEIYVCFRLLKRLTMKSEFFLEVFNSVFPYLQATVGENYGGNLHISLE